MHQRVTRRAAIAAAALLAPPLAASRVDAALITFDLRATGTNALTTKSAVVPPTGGTVTFDVYAVVQNLDGNHNNEGFLRLNTGLISTEASTGWMGNISPATLDPTYIDTSLSQTGSQANLDSNPDLELGGANPGNAAGYLICNSGTSTRFSTAGTGTGATEFRLCSATWVAGANLGASTQTTLQLAMRVAPGILAAAKTVGFTSDGVAYTVKGDDPLVAIGAPIVIGVPEPSSSSLIVMAGGGLTMRRRRRQKS